MTTITVNPHIDLTKSFIVNHGSCQTNIANGGPFSETQLLNAFEIIQIGAFDPLNTESFVSSIKQGNFSFSQVELYDAMKAKLAEWKGYKGDLSQEPALYYLLPQMTAFNRKLSNLDEKVGFVVGSVSLYFDHIKRGKMDDRR